MEWMLFVTDIKSLLKFSFIVQANKIKKAELKHEWGDQCEVVS